MLEITTQNPYAVSNHDTFVGTKDNRKNPRHLAWFTIGAVTGLAIGGSILEGFLRFMGRFLSDGLLVQFAVFAFISFCLGNLGYDRSTLSTTRRSDIWIRVTGGIMLGIGFQLLHCVIHYGELDSLKVFIKRRGILFEFACQFIIGIASSLSTEFTVRAIRPNKYMNAGRKSGEGGHC